MTIDSPPNKLEYGLNEPLNEAGLRVVSIYINGSTIDEDISNSNISGFDSSSPGEKIITVTKNGLSATFTITVNPPSNPETVLVSLSISSLPHKLVYEQGENANWSGLEVTGTYSDGSTENETIGSSDISGFDSSSPGVKTITISKSGISANFTITVNPSLNPEVVLVSLSISSLPDKLVYELDESANWSGLKVRETYSDDSSKIETNYSNYDISGFDSSSAGEKPITVTKSGISAVFAITVNPTLNPEVVLVSLSISSLPDKLVYELDESANWSVLKVRETYSDDSSRIETNYSNYNISGFNSSSPGEQTITVTKDSVSAMFTVTVRNLVSLSISSLPDKVVYDLYESANWTGLEVTGTYSDGSVRVEPSYNISGFDAWTMGKQTIGVSKNGISAAFTVTVRALYSLFISSLPDKLEYEPGDNPNWSGLEVTGTYFDGSNMWDEIIDHGNYDIDGFDSSSPGEKYITVTKIGISNGFTVAVEGLSSLSISTEPDKKVYELDESPDWTGLMVVGHYFIKGPQIETIDYNSEISGFDSSGPGIKTIYVTKNGVSVSFTIEVLPKSSGGITILPPSQAADIALTSAGTTVTAPGGYTGYQWFVDEMPRPADNGSGGKALTLSAPEYVSGTYRVWVIAYKQGLPYSGEIYLTLP
jgi:hypothetical protein